MPRATAQYTLAETEHNTKQHTPQTTIQAKEKKKTNNKKQGKPRKQNKKQEKIYFCLNKLHVFTDCVGLSGFPTTIVFFALQNTTTLYLCLKRVRFSFRTER